MDNFTASTSATRTALEVALAEAYSAIQNGSSEEASDAYMAVRRSFASAVTTEELALVKVVLEAFGARLDADRGPIVPLVVMG